MIAVARKNYDLLQLLNSRRDREECLASVCHTTQLIHSLWTPTCFCLWATVNSPGMNIGAQISLRDIAFGFLSYITRNEIAEVYGSMIFNLLVDHNVH